jgi:hypothetical protein
MLTADVVGMVMSSAGKAISCQSRSRSEVDTFAGAIGDMLRAYLDFGGKSNSRQK